MKKLKYLPRKFLIFDGISIVIVILINFLICKRYYSSQETNPFCPRPIETRKKIYNNFEDITFITVPRKFTNGNLFERNKLAIHSWLSVSNKSRVLLFIYRNDFDPTDKFPSLLDKLYGPNRVIYAGPIRADHKSIPYIDDWFIKGIQYVESKYVCFVNSDIVLSSGWLTRVKQVYAVLKDKPVIIIGQRIDFDLKPELLNELHYGSNNFLKEIDEFVMKCNHSDHSPYGIDTFTFRTDVLPFDPQKIPPFIMGRYNWDNWLVGFLNDNESIHTVTFNLSPPVYHVNHQRHNFDVKEDRVAVNHHLRLANKEHFGSNYDTYWEIKDEKLTCRSFPDRFDLPNVDDVL